MGRVILASGSPRRRELLCSLCEFEVIVPDVEETECGDPKDVALNNAALKGRSIAEKADLIISCDTLVALDGVIYGKPGNRETAKKTLMILSGRTHRVISGVCLRYGGGEELYTVESEVTFRQLTEEDIDKYIDKCQPFDKAGAYGIQDGEIVSGYSGDYDNIVGLPLQRIREVILKLGL